MHRFCRLWISFFLLVVAVGTCVSPLLFADPLTSPEQGSLDFFAPQESQEKSTFSDIFFKKYTDEVAYLDLNLVGEDVVKNFIIGVPPVEGSELDQEDEATRKAIANPDTNNLDQNQKEELINQKLAAFTAIDNVFAFSAVLGEGFNYKKLKKTEAFFQKIDGDVSVAVNAAKKTFRRPRPMKSSGFSYPSGHSTRAFVREALLSEIFPNCQEALYKQAQQFAQNRVIMGRHYPRDIAAGEIYGKYLADQFHKNPQFEKEWENIKQEIVKVFKHPQNVTPLLTPVVTPAIAPVVPAIAPDIVQ